MVKRKFEGDFGVTDTPPHILDTFFACIGKIISELTRPVDAIKHQAKTVTVGTSRLAETATGLLFDALGQNGFEPDQLSTALTRLEMEELFGLSAEKVSERILAVLRTESAAAIVPNP